MNPPARLLALLLLFAGAGRGMAQPDVPVQLNVDHAAFAYNQASSLLELYLAFDAASLRFTPAGGAFSAELPVDLVLRRSTEASLPGTPSEPVWQDSMLLRFTVPDTSALQAGQQFVHQFRTAIPPGEYELSLRLPADSAAGRRELELRRDVLVPDYARAGEVGLSGITLSSGIQASQDTSNPFYKNGLTIQPNADQLYGQGLARLFYYAEVYNPAGVAGDDGTYELYAYVSEANRPQPVGELQRRTEREVRSPDVLVGSFDLATLPSGAYFLRLVVLNDRNESVAEQTRKFFVYNPSVAREEAPGFEQSFETSPYATMPEPQVAAEVEQISLIASERERRRVRGIQDLNERRRFLMEFWQARDPQPSTALNEFKETFVQRLQYANDRYSSSNEEGWRSDRGRVVVKYGIPSNIEPHLYERDMAPYEIWTYHNIPGEGQATFVFADRDGFGRFDLVHATVPGERSLPNWQQELRN